MAQIKAKIMVKFKAQIKAEIKLKIKSIVGKTGKSFCYLIIIISNAVDVPSRW